MKSIKKKQDSDKQSPAKPSFAMKYFNSIKHPRAFALVLFVIIFASVGAYLYTTSRAVGNAVLSLTPSSSSPALGSTFTVTIYVNSYAVPVNAVQANLTYNTSLLEMVDSNPTEPGINADLSTGAFTTAGQNTGGNGTINIGVASLGANRINSQIVAVVTFRAIGVGSAAVNFTTGSAVVSATQNNELGTATNPLANANGGTYTIADRTSPSPPTGVTATSNNPTSVTLSWTGSTDNIGVTGYNIFRNGTAVGTSTITSFTNNNVSPGTYNYTVQARDAAGNLSSQSAVTSYTLTDRVAPSVPSGLTMTLNSTNSISFSWTASTDNVGVTRYEVYRNGALAGSSNTNSFTNNTGLTANTAYSYTVSAYDAAGNASAQSTASSFRTTMKTGDVNDDGAVNIYDLSILATNFGRSGTSAQGDLNNDGAVNVYDLSILATNWGL